eukprot:GSChrysophyteH2.ASY1.ANO1.819.1 assembled CDS
MEHAAKCLHTWRENLQVGDPVDAYDQRHRTWYTARVATAPTPTPSKSSPLAIELHWLGFSGNQKVALVSDVHDPTWGISPANSRVIKSNLRHTIRGFTRNKEKHILEWEHKLSLIPNHYKNYWISNNPKPVVKDDDDSSSAPAVYGQQGRRPVLTVIDENAPRPLDFEESVLLLPSDSRRRTNSSIHKKDGTSGNDGDNDEDDEDKKVVVPPKDGEDDNDWVCGICEMLEAEEGSELMLCDGPCMRSFHTKCIDLDGAHDRDEVGGVWLCTDCKTGAHDCFICGEKGKDFFEVMRCSFAKCGKYYHKDCLLQLDSSSSSSRKSFRFKCPLHACRVCHEFYLNNQKAKGSAAENSRFEVCIKCPIAYHVNCIPPGTRFNSTCLLCSRHPEAALPSREARSFTQSKGGIWEQMLIGDDPPEASDVNAAHYKLELHLKDSVNNSNEAPKHHVLNRLSYDSLPRKGAELPVYSSGETGQCTCKGKTCDDDCINHVLKVECCGNDHEKRSNCNIGPSCSNRRFQQKQWAKIVRFREHAMGWGCKAGEDIKEGSLVIEYVGEVINLDEMQQRMNNQREFTPHDHEFYIMELDNGFFVDGKHKGNDSRFINHSCDPNCELERWVVNGKMRIGIFAVKDIAKGDPLSYDYQFDTNEVSAFKCYCGTDLCRGTMAPKQKGARTAADLSDKQRTALIKQGEQREKKSIAVLRGEEYSRSLTDKYLPGDSVRPIRDGPHRPSLLFGGRKGAFLCRNIIDAPPWKMRRALMWAEAERAAIFPYEEDKGLHELERLDALAAKKKRRVVHRGTKRKAGGVGDDDADTNTTSSGGGAETAETTETEVAGTSPGRKSPRRGRRPMGWAADL